MTDLDESDVYWITDPAQFECLMSARRLDIVDQLANAGALSVREIASMLAVKPSSLYHHIELLLDAGLIEEAGERTVKRRKERLYRTPARAMRYGLLLNDPAAREIYGRLGEVQARQTARDLAEGVASKNVVGEGAARNLRVFRLVGAPGREAMARINFHLEALADLFWQSAGQQNPRIAISTIMAPIGAPEDGQDDS